MFEKLQSYTNYNGEKVKKVLRFNLRKDELYIDVAGRGKLITEYADLTDGFDGTNVSPKNFSGKNRARLLAFIDDFISLSYGEKSEDGEYFDKSPEILHRFKCSPAYEAFFMDILEHPENFGAFIKQTMPSEMNSIIDEYIAEASKEDADTSTEG